MPVDKVPSHLKIKGKHGITWISPSFDPEMLPAEAASILKRSYAAIRDDQYSKDKSSRENKAMKTKAASIAWSNVAKAGFKKNKDGKWIKTKKSQSFSKPIQLFANQIYLNRNEILSHIPEEVYSEIKRTDRKPTFAPYVIAHEGYSTPRIIGEGQTKIYWPRKAIESFKKIVKKGVKFFVGHNEDNSTEGRKEVGSVVGSFQKEVDGKLNQIAIAYFPNQRTADIYKVCSIEAMANFIEKAGEVIADGIHELTGIALGINETPAFPETGQIGYIQAFGESANNINKGDNKMGNLTLKEMQAEIAENGWNPGQLFGMESIISDPVFMKRLTDAKKTLVDVNEWEAHQKLKTDFEALQGTQKELQEKLTKYDMDIQKNTAKTRYEDKVKELKLTEKQKKFFDMQYNKLTDFTDESLDKFITESHTAYKELTSAGLLNDVVPNVTASQTTEEANPFIIED